MSNHYAIRTKATNWRYRNWQLFGFIRTVTIHTNWKGSGIL